MFLRHQKKHEDSTILSHHMHQYSSNNNKQNRERLQRVHVIDSRHNHWKFALEMSTYMYRFMRLYVCDWQLKEWNNLVIYYNVHGVSHPRELFAVAIRLRDARDQWEGLDVEKLRMLHRIVAARKTYIMHIIKREILNVSSYGGCREYAQHWKMESRQPIRLDRMGVVPFIKACAIGIFVGWRVFGRCSELLS